MQFIDDEDPLDVATGVVTSIVRHLSIGNHQTLDQEPTDLSDFEYIDLNYAVSNCKWSKYRPTATALLLLYLRKKLISIVVSHAMVSRGRGSERTNEKHSVS